MRSFRRSPFPLFLPSLAEFVRVTDIIFFRFSRAFLRTFQLFALLALFFSFFPDHQLIAHRSARPMRRFGYSFPFPVLSHVSFHGPVFPMPRATWPSPLVLPRLAFCARSGHVYLNRMLTLSRLEFSACITCSPPPSSSCFLFLSLFHDQ